MKHHLPVKVFVGRSLPLLPLLCLLLVSACRNQDVEPPYPVSLNALKNVQLTPASLTKPTTVSVIASTLSTPASWTALNADIALAAASGQLTTGLTRASVTINNALTNARLTASQLVSSFAPEVIENLAAQRTLNPSLQKMVTDVTTDTGVQTYLSIFTYGRVNGREIGLTYKTPEPAEPAVSMIQPVVAVPVSYTGPSGPYKSANDLYDVRIGELNAVRTKQVDAINAAYDTENTAISNDVTAGLSTVATRYATLIASARQNVISSLASLNTVKTRIGDQVYNSLAALVYVHYASQVQLYDRLQTADRNGQNALRDARTLANSNARDTDLNKINGDFNAAVASARDQLEMILDLQGEGR